MSLTDKQKECVVKSWDLVKKNFKPNSVAFFLYFFETNPDMQQKFDSFRGKSLEEIKESVQLRSHGSRVFHAISSLIDNLDDLELVVEIVKKTVGDHHPRGIVSGDYEKLFNSIVGFLAKALAEAFCADTKAGWVNVAAILMGVINSEIAILAAAKK